MTLRKSRASSDSMLQSRKLSRPGSENNSLGSQNYSLSSGTLRRSFLTPVVRLLKVNAKLRWLLALLGAALLTLIYQSFSGPSIAVTGRGHVARSAKATRPAGTASKVTSKTPSVHIAMIFDENRKNFSRTVMRSLSFYANEKIIYHLVAPRGLHKTILENTDDLLGTKRIIMYDYNQCLIHVRKVSFISKAIHSSAFCKIFLSHIIPSTDHVLYIDSDITVVQDISPCWFKTVGMEPKQYIGMSVDMGGICQIDPDHCYPVGFDWVIPEGLQCGTVPYRAVQNLEADPDHACRIAGQREPYQFNGGVMLMDLGKMRMRNFTDKFVRASIYTWRTLNFKRARWGEQDLMNNFFRLYPETLFELDCGCNYQYSASRREVKCAGKPVVIAHGWTRQLLDESSPDMYNRHFDFFRFNVPTEDSQPPAQMLTSLVSPDWPHPTSNTKRHTPLCDHQVHDCSLNDRFEAENMILRLDDKVNVLTRTARRPTFFAENAESVREQTHPYIQHHIVTDDKDSMSYLQNTSALLIPSLYHQFDPNEVCKRCKGPDASSCARAPPPSEVQARQEFFDCFCSTNYPMNAYMSYLQDRVSEGWIIYLDDDNLFLDRYAVSELLAHVTFTDKILAFRSILGRPTPMKANFGKRIVMGDFDASNFAFHSKHKKYATWGTKRCGDYWAASSLARHLDIQWINGTFIQTHPLRASLGGLGARGESVTSQITVVITSYNVEGWRPQWLQKTIHTYLSTSYRPIIAKVILVWNNVDNMPPEFDIEDPYRLVVIRAQKNSLNNRWVEVLPFVDTDKILNLDDDLYISKAGIICMMNWQAQDPTRMVSPFVRRIEANGTYILDELKDSSPYTMVLPRAILLSRTHLELYKAPQYSHLRDYVDLQEAHCDDVVLNMIVLKHSGKPPLRVVLPRGTLVDFYTMCWTKNHMMVGGLGLQHDRVPKRSECVSYIMRHAGIDRMIETKTMGACLPRGNRFMQVEYATPPRYDAMIDFSLNCVEL